MAYMKIVSATEKIELEGLGKVCDQPICDQTPDAVDNSLNCV